MSKRKHLGEIYLAFRFNLARAVHNIVPPDEVEDIVQETYVRMCLVKNTADIRHPRAYLLRTARNLAFDYLKRAETRLSDSLPDDGEPELSDIESMADDTFQQVATSEEFGLFCEAVRYLPVSCRRVFVLKKVYGYSQRDIAQELRLSESTVEKHIAQAVKRCTSFMLSHSDIHSVVREPALIKAKKEKGGE